MTNVKTGQDARSADPDDPVFIHYAGVNGVGYQYRSMRHGAPTSGVIGAANRIYIYPVHLLKPYPLARWFWCSGATVVGTNTLQLGFYDENFNLVAACPPTAHGGTANNVQYVSPGIWGGTVTFGALTTDATTYTTASVTLKKGMLYLMSVVDGHASAAPAISSIDGGPTFTSRSTVTYATGLRVSVWSVVPTVDYTGTLVINFGATTATGCLWSLHAFGGVDTTTNDGIVQQVTATGTSTLPTATLGAFGSADNATFLATGATGSSVGTQSTGYIELSDQNSNFGTPSVAAQYAYYTGGNDTTPDHTIGTSQPFGACAIELKSLGTAPIVIPAGRYNFGFTCTGATSTFFRYGTPSGQNIAGQYMTSGSGQATGLQLAPTVTGSGGSGTVMMPYVVGFTRRSSP